MGLTIKMDGWFLDGSFLLKVAMILAFYWIFRDAGVAIGRVGCVFVRGKRRCI